MAAQVVRIAGRGDAGDLKEGRIVTRRRSAKKKSPAVRDTIAQVFEELGGASGMVKWLSENEDMKKVFYTQIWPKIIGIEAKEPDTRHDPITEIRQTIVDPRR